MEKRQFLFTLLGVLLTMLLPTGCDRQQQFDLAEREFRRVTDLQSELLGEVLSSYAAQGPEKFGTLNTGYMRDGTFDLLESLDEEAGRLLDRMVRFCDRRRVKQLVECLELRARLTRRFNDAEAPFIYRDYPPPWEVLEPDADEWARRLYDCRRSGCEQRIDKEPSR